MMHITAQRDACGHSPRRIFMRHYNIYGLGFGTGGRSGSDSRFTRRKVCRMLDRNFALYEFSEVRAAPLRSADVLPLLPAKRGVRLKVNIRPLARTFYDYLRNSCPYHREEVILAHWGVSRRVGVAYGNRDGVSLRHRHFRELHSW